MRAIFYIDGFNFYYLRTKQQPNFKWLNLKKLADNIVDSSTSVEKVNYYTAPVSGKADPDAPRRQARLFSALRTVPEIEIHRGRFLHNPHWPRLVKPARAKPESYVWNQPEPKRVLANKSEEKGSDVNLASHLLRDAFTNKFDIAYIVTNDTDFVEPMRIVRDEVGKKICIVAPNRPGRHTAKNIPIPAPSLRSNADFVHYIDDAELSASQFPDIVHRTGKKPISKPPSWSKQASP